MNILRRLKQGVALGRAPRRHYYHYAWLFILVSAWPLSGSAAEPGREPGSAVGAFYKVYLTTRPLGVPQAKELTRFKPFLSTELQRLLNEAGQAEQHYHEATKGEAPPLAEGDLFTSLFEGPTAFRVRACEFQANSTSCSVEFTYVDPRDRSSHKWQDKVYLVRESSRWLVDDVEYLGDWQFMHKGRLKGVLRQIIADSKRS